jgi:hypothetical protein
MISFFQFFTKKMRLSNPWRYKVPLLVSFCYFLLLAGNVEPVPAKVSFVAALATTIGFMGFGYLTEKKMRSQENQMEQQTFLRFLFQS